MVWSSTCVAPWKVMSSSLCIVPCLLMSISAGACTAKTLCWLAVITAKQIFVKKYRTMIIIISKRRFGSISISSALFFCLLTFKHRISVCTELWVWLNIGCGHSCQLTSLGMPAILWHLSANCPDPKKSHWAWWNINKNKGLISIGMMGSRRNIFSEGELFNAFSGDVISRLTRVLRDQQLKSYIRILSL